MDTWEFHLNFIAQSESLYQKAEELTDGLTKLRQVFNDVWLEHAREQRHPLLGYLLNKDPWSQFWLAEFGRKIHLLKGLPKFEKLAKRLIESREYTGARAEVEVATRLMEAGITDIELYPRIKINGKEKEPELKARLNDKDTYFEVTTLRESEASVRAMETHRDLTFAFFDHETLREVFFYCQIHKILSKPHIEELKAKIQKAIAEVRETREYAPITEPGVMDYLVIHRSKPEEFIKTLTDSLGIKREISGPPIETDDVRRLKGSLRAKAKAKQLPQDKPGVLVVFGNLTYVGSSQQFYEELVYEIEETIYDQANLILGIIINEIGLVGEVNVVEQKPNYILVRKSHNLWQKDAIVIKNRYSKFPINDKIVTAFVD